MQVLVLGHPDAVLGFSLAGVKGRAIASIEEANRALDEALEDRDLGVVLVTRDVAAMMQSKMDRLKLRSTLPLIVEIPSPEGMQPGEPSLNEVVLRAIGIRL
jgi:V/A-type H+-transporting ATPase subunit F